MIMTKFLFAVLISCLSLTAFCSDPDYSVTAIPKELFKNANVVKRMEQMRFEIISTGETILYQKYALTILNEAGSKYSQFSQYYDKLISIRSIEGALYDADGKLLKKLKNKDIQDVSGVDDNNLFDDNRVKAHNFYYSAYPYTVEYEIEVKFNHTLFMPTWIPQEFENLAVENSHLVLIYPTAYKIRFKALNYKGEPVAGSLKNKNTMEWKVNNLPAIKKSFAFPKWNELTTAVYLAASDFEIENYKGNMNSWSEFGKFQSVLNKDRDKLPEEIVEKVKLTAGLATDFEKIKVLYKFLQQNTRYISIQLGIGGWQPFEASYVAKKGYGDCKALTNYMYSLLKAAGIKSYHALVSAGSDTKNHQMIIDFPSSQFNHVILCVPQAKDSIWLECTSQIMTAGYMGDFTGNRHALLITEEGGKVVATPRYGLKDNLQIRSVKGKVNSEGSLDVKVNTSYLGTQQDDLQGMLNYLSKDKVKKVLNEHLDLSTYDINDFTYKETKSALPQIEEQLDIYVSGYATITGKRLFIYPNLLNRSSIRVPDEERLYDFVFDHEYRDVDSIEFQIPEGYAIEAIPQQLSLKTKYGSYTSSVRVENDKLYYLRVREQYAGRFPAKEKEELSKFFEAIYKADRSKVVLVKKSE
jgi:hypothetical protein